MKVIVHGAAKEVGRSCIELVTEKNRFLFDAGVKLGDETEYPSDVKNIKDITATFMSHAHLDHSGAFPFLQSKGLRCPIYLTPTTKDIAKILLRDFYKVESLNHIPPYSKESIFAAFDLFKTKHYNEAFEVNDAYVQFFDAGHVPGSSLILMEVDGKRIAYTGDIRLSDTRLLKGADINVRDVDALIIETTYGNREHPDRKKTEREFLSKIRDVVNTGGSVFIPAFAVGRSQEMLLLLHTENWDVPVYLDGISQDVMNLILEHNACKDKESLIRAREKTIFIKGGKERERALQSQGIFVTTSGMLTGGPIIDYLKAGHQNPRNAILVTGYVMEGTNGRMLLEQGCVFIDGKRTKVKAQYQTFNFSAHAGLAELQQIIKRINPKKLILVHGEAASMEHLAALERKNGREVLIPELNNEIYI
jgi:putative mRNA 3-end processing factor